MESVDVDGLKRAFHSVVSEADPGLLQHPRWSAL